MIVDDESRLALLRRAALADAQLFECDDRSWERLREHGPRAPQAPARRARLGRPACEQGPRAAPCSACRGRRPRRGSSGPSPPAPCPTSAPTTSSCSPGEATDRFTTVVRDAHLSAGCTLAWVEAPAGARGRPRPLLADPRPARPRRRQGAGGPDRGRHGRRRAVARDAPRGPRGDLGRAWPRPGWARKARKLADEVTALAPWWGGRLRVLVLDARVNRTDQQPGHRAGLPPRAHRAPPGRPARPRARARRGGRAARPGPRPPRVPPASRSGRRRARRRVLARRHARLLTAPGVGRQGRLWE